MDELNKNQAETFENLEKNSKKSLLDKLKKYFFQMKILINLNWKKYLKQAGKITNLVILTLVCLGIIIYFAGDIFGLRTNIFVEKISYKKYSHIGPNFSFKYPEYYEIDNGEEKSYGETYLTGLKLKTDSRTGCDIRSSKKGINFTKSDKEINDALSKEISKSAKDFTLLSYARIKIDGETAFSQEFIFTDPLGNRTMINQVMAGHNKNFYIFICGTGEHQYKFFKEDFQSFLNSFSWK
ncbi:MAG: hypothetical protein WAV16_03990 [Candidatus Moraniibacteriota bacterium]